MTQLTRRQMLSGLIASGVVPARAETPWPNRAITLIHGFPPGGPVDIVARILAEALSRRLGQQVVVDPKPGAAGTMAAAQAARATPDGYTLFAIPATHTGTAAMYRTLPYRPIDDFALISTTVEYPYVLVTYAGHSIRTLADVITRAKLPSAPLQYGTAGVGSLQHLSMELFAKMAGLRLQHIPYRGGAPAITDLLAQRIDLLLDPPTALIQHIGDGRLRALAETGRDRFFSFPDVPTIAEAGFPSFAVSAFQGIAAPAGLPGPALLRLNGEIAAVLSDPAVVEKLRKLGNNPAPSSPEQFKARLIADIAQWSKLIADANIDRI
jgi:tripartite-type tricarboxylate transporter receptor subunit TctC